MGETQPDMERLEVVTFIYPFSLEAVSWILSAARIKFFTRASLDFMWSFTFFFKNTLHLPPPNYSVLLSFFGIAHSFEHFSPNALQLENIIWRKLLHYIEFPLWGLAFLPLPLIQALYISRK